jgi:heptaprenyl diphosphate synthase
MAKKTAYMGMLTALAFVFSYIESLLPINLGVPGIKLGLANLVIIVTLYTIGIKAACTLSLVRIVLTGFTFGNPVSMIYSLAGGILSLVIMILAKRSKTFSVTGVSVLGGVFHNFGQIMVAAVVVEMASLFYYLPVLILSGTIAGVAIGMLASILIQRLIKMIEQNESK